MKEFKREHYNLKEYKNERFMMEITDEELHISTTKYADNIEILYMEAKEEAKKGKQCAIWELRYEFEG